jgi:hypothetical protein
VGIPQSTGENVVVERKQIETILENSSLRTLYIDRIFARKDLSRLSDPRVRELVTAAIGLHEQLAPELLAAANASKHQVEAS